MIFKILATSFLLSIPVLIVDTIGFAITAERCFYKASRIFKKIILVSGTICAADGFIALCIGIFYILKAIWS